MLIALCGNVQRLSAPLRQLTSRLSLHTQRSVLEQFVFRPTTYFTLVTPLRNAGTKRLFEVKPSEFLNARALDTLHFYAMLGLVPCLVLVFLVNMFVGPAELTDIPEGYEPRHWEYHKHPISRFIAKYMSPHPQKVYESFLGQLDDIREQKELIPSLLFAEPNAISCLRISRLLDLSSRTYPRMDADGTTVAVINPPPVPIRLWLAFSLWTNSQMLDIDVNT
ncbi:hypothetical protein CRM22_002256 [Opisthorchis felineus]|uniref:NADH dehydrogenase [ubiquinone] 1 beta subcomplex subunit 5, mitochondrial n=1 Tax=Opisthorchis felineus TaxID=147828 RepID=A0A4S2MCU2_OPIFE|nr:hypothetical protein CRM22_002256 [Opisthorchis felineus]